MSENEVRARTALDSSRPYVGGRCFSRLSSLACVRVCSGEIRDTANSYKEKRNMPCTRYTTTSVPVDQHQQTSTATSIAAAATTTITTTTVDATTAT